MKVRDFEWWIVGILGLISFFLAMQGFHIIFSEAGVHRSIIDLAFQSFKIFGMEFVDDFTSPLPWQLETARWLAPGVLLYTAVKAVLYFIRREFKSLMVKHKRSHIIVTSLNQRSRYLVSDLLARGEYVIVIATIDDPRKLDLLEKEGAVIIEGDLSSEKFLKNIAAQRCKYMVFIDDDDDTNISSAILVYNLLIKHGRDRKQTLYTHVADDLKLNELRELNFFEEYTEQNMNSQNCEIRIFSSYERSSRVLFNLYSPDTFKKISSPADGQLHVALIGSGRLAQSMIIRLARLGHYANLVNLKVTLFHEGGNIVTRIRRNFKHIHSLIDLETIDEDLELFDADKFEALHLEQPFNAVYILCEDDALSSAILNKITKVETDSTIEVILTLHNPEGILSKWYTASKIDRINLHKFNIIEESFTGEALISEKLDELAKVIHTDYLSGIKTLNPDKASHRPWELLPLDFKNQNREQADHLAVKLRALDEGDPMELVEKISPEQLELLSEMEHRRWMAHMALSGWTLGEKRDDSRKRHTDLVPYAELSEEVKQYDRDTILNIPRLLKKYNEKHSS